MKSKIFLLFLIILCLFIVTGCINKTQNSNTAETSNKDEDIVYVTIGEEKFKLKSPANLNNLHYLENYVDFYTDRYGNIEIMSYPKGQEPIFEIRMAYEEEHSIDEVKAIVAVDKEEKTKEINGISYTYYDYLDENGQTVHYYLYEYNNMPYSIIFFLGENPGDIEEVFMNNVSFE